MSLIYTPIIVFDYAYNNSESFRSVFSVHVRTVRRLIRIFVVSD